MARRIDPEIQENVDRGPGDEQNPEGIDAEKNKSENATHLSDTIKNANAAGLGAIGRNDEKQKGDDADQLADQGNS